LLFLWFEIMNDEGDGCSKTQANHTYQCELAPTETLLFHLYLILIQISALLLKGFATQVA